MPVLELYNPENINPVFLVSSLKLTSGVLTLMLFTSEVELNLSCIFVDSKNISGYSK